MRLLVYADLQAHDGDDRCYNQPSSSLQIYRVRKFYEDLAHIYKEHACDGLVDLGDTTDDRSAIPVPVIEHVIGGLEPFVGSEFNFKLIGNHEQFLRDTTVDSGRMFSHVFRVINQRAVWEHEGTVYVFASYPDKHESLNAWLDTVTKKHTKPKVLFGHFQVVGATLNSGEAVLGVQREIVERFKVALLGHIHLGQTLGSSIHYVGSPFQQHWGEAGQDKRLAVFDTETREVTWVPLSGYPRYIQSDLATFRQHFDETSEDRWKVLLRDHAETETFFALPFSHRAEAVYNYAESAPVEADQEVKDWSFEASLRHWTQASPPASAGIDLTNEELLEYGRQLALG